MNRRAAVTLLEVLASITIVTLLVGLLSPVLASAQTSAQKARSKVKLRQLAVAVQLYRSDFGEVGGPSGIGLPLDELFIEKYGMVVPRDYLTGGPPRPYANGIGPSMYYMMFPGIFAVESTRETEGDKGVERYLDRWGEHVRSRGGTPVLFMDISFNPIASYRSPFYERYAFAVFTDGHIENKSWKGGLSAPLFAKWD